MSSLLSLAQPLCESTVEYLSHNHSLESISNINNELIKIVNMYLCM